MHASQERSLGGIDNKLKRHARLIVISQETQNARSRRNDVSAQLISGSGTHALAPDRQHRRQALHACSGVTGVTGVDAPGMVLEYSAGVEISHLIRWV